MAHADAVAYGAGRTGEGGTDLTGEPQEIAEKAAALYREIGDEVAA
jgi:hypothetical protein